LKDRGLARVVAVIGNVEDDARPVGRTIGGRGRRDLARGDVLTVRVFGGLVGERLDLDRLGRCVSSRRRTLALRLARVVPRVFVPLAFRHALAGD